MLLATYHHRLIRYAVLSLPEDSAETRSSTPRHSLTANTEAIFLLMKLVERSFAAYK